MTRFTTPRATAAAFALAIGTAAIGTTTTASAQDYQAYVENAQRLAAPHAYYGEPWPHFAKNDHTPHYDAWGRDLNGPPFRDSCDGLYYGTGDHSCGSMTGGPVGGLASRN